jgi:hypothetical protein
LSSRPFIRTLSGLRCHPDTFIRTFGEILALPLFPFVFRGKVNQFAANSRHFPRTEKTGVAAGIYDLQQLTTAKDQALSRAHCGGSFVSGCYRSIIPNAQATSFAVRLPFSGIISIICIAKITGLFFCGF